MSPLCQLYSVVSNTDVDLLAQKSANKVVIKFSTNVCFLTKNPFFTEKYQYSTKMY